MIVLDASVLIAYLDGDDRHHTRAHQLLAREIQSDFASSILTLAEVLVVPARENRLAAARRALHDLDVMEVPMATGAAEVLASIRVETGLKMPDCCVLLAAEQLRADVASFDERLLSCAVERGLGTLSS